MTTQQLTSMSARIQAALGEAELTQLGFDTQFTRRLREVTPHRLAVSLVSTLATRRVSTLADLLRGFNALTERAVQYKPFHNQLVKSAFPHFMRAVFEHLLKQFLVKVLTPLPAHALRRFQDIVIHDGSSFALQDSLQERFPGRFTAVKPAAVEVHATMSVLHDQPLRVTIAPDCLAEKHFLPDPAWLSGKLLLADRGYGQLEYCRSLVDANASFIIRFKKDVNPTILQGEVIQGRPLKVLGKKLRDLKLQGRSLDVDVEWTKGRRPLTLRLVLLWNPRERRHVVLVTNLPRSLDAESISQLYRLRWQVELLFKEWKSHANLHRFATGKATIAEGLIWASLSAALLSRFLAHATQLVLRVETSTRTVALAAVHRLQYLAEAIIRGRDPTRVLKRLLDFLALNARRAHPARDRLTGRLNTGLRPTWLNAGLALCPQRTNV